MEVQSFFPAGEQQLPATPSRGLFAIHRKDIWPHLPDKRKPQVSLRRSGLQIYQVK